MFQCHNLRWAGQCAFAAFQTVGIEIANLLSSAVVRCELHRTNAGAIHTLHLTSTRYVDIRKGLGQWCFLGGYPARDGTHGAERAPGAWCIDERKDDANNSGHHDNVPEDATDSTPHRQSSLAPRNGECQLDAKHSKDEEHHEQAETARTHECWYWLVG